MLSCSCASTQRASYDLSWCCSQCHTFSIYVHSSPESPEVFKCHVVMTCLHALRRFDHMSPLVFIAERHLKISLPPENIISVAEHYIHCIHLVFFFRSIILGYYRIYMNII
jgi:hypothetical protein